MTQSCCIGAGARPTCRGQLNCESQDHGSTRRSTIELIERSRSPRSTARAGRASRCRYPATPTAPSAPCFRRVARRYGHEGLPDDTIHQFTLHRHRPARASARSCAHGHQRRDLDRRCQRLCRQGLSGGTHRGGPTRQTPTFAPEENIIVGNTVLYGAIAASVSSAASPASASRFAIQRRVTAVVEGVGDHGCEYMTGGVVVVLGDRSQLRRGHERRHGLCATTSRQRIRTALQPAMVELEAVAEPIPKSRRRSSTRRPPTHNGHTAPTTACATLGRGRAAAHHLIEAPSHRVHRQTVRFAQMHPRRLGRIRDQQFVKVLPNEYRRAARADAERPRQQATAPTWPTVREAWAR